MNRQANGWTMLAVASGVLGVVGAAAAAEKAETPTPATQPATQAALSVDQIVQKTNYVSYYQGADGRAQVKMTIVDAQQNKRTREFTILRWDQPPPKPKDEKQPAAGKSAGKADEAFTGEQKFYVYFHRPADVNRTAFLVWKHLDKDDDRWLYLPDLDLVKRIAATDKRTSFVGSHFFYEDVSGRNIADDRHELVEASKDYYVLKNTPKDTASVEFGHFTMWIHRASFVVVRSVYYDKQGKAYRQYDARKVQTIQGYPTVTHSRMTDLRDGSYSDLEYTDVKYDVGLPEALFAERFLKRTPYTYLK